MKTNRRTNVPRPVVSQRRPFLTADWRWLVMVNYEIDPAVLRPYLPRGTELDLCDGVCLASMVGFLFERTRIYGRFAIPGHSVFEEVNLRFYVTRSTPTETRRGVVFIKELVPSRSVTWVARTLYSENYQRVPMRHEFTWNEPTVPSQGGRFAYAWRRGGAWSELAATTQGPLAELSPGSHAEFIAEHYWGYSRHRRGPTLEYEVAHPSWRAWQVKSCHLHADVERLYGPEFVPALTATPHSALVAEGSAVAVYPGARIA